MEANNRIYARGRRSKKFRYITIGVVIFIVLLIVIIPIAVLVPKSRSTKGLTSNIILPLYIYPLNGAWDPLYEVLVAFFPTAVARQTADLNRLTAYPRQNFTIIVNPESGPGSSALPSDDYVSQIQKLNKYPNALTIGYVRTGWARRSLNDALHDVSVYSGWATNATGLAVHGIFFDETPSEYSQEGAEFLTKVNQAAKDASGLLGDKTVRH